MQITIEFEPDADYSRSRQYVAERLSQVELPPGTETPLLSGVTGRLNEIFEITVEATPGVADLMTLRDLAENEVKNRVEIRIVYDQSELVESSLGGVGRAVLIGAALVALVLFGLLGNIRAALIVTPTLPLSLALSGVVMRFAGIGINTMTLGGLAIAVGLLVDSSIIVVENVVHRISQRRDGDRRGHALAAAAEVGRPIAFATASMRRCARHASAACDPRS